MVCAFMLIVQCCRVARPELFGINAGYYLSGDGGWAGQMQPAAASADGATGLVPAPLTGQQNSYLRGDGKWVQANNAPTAAMYLMVTNMANVTPPAVGGSMPFANVLSTTNSIPQPTTSTFILSVGITYKCTAFLSLNTDYGLPVIIYMWYNNTLTTFFGEGGAANLSSAAIGYITPLTTTTISLQIIHNSGGTLFGLSNDKRGSWATIEAVSNNNTISPFTGASGATNGFIGYVPAPQVGQQNHVLTGAGTWSPMITAMTPVKLTGNSVMFSNIPASARRVTVMLADVGIGGNTQVRLRLGAGGIAVDGYSSNAIFVGASTAGEFRDDGFHTSAGILRVGERRNGTYTLSHLGNNTWVCTGQFSPFSAYIAFCSGSITLSGVLDRVQLSVTNAADTFVAGTVNVMYE
jgi:hypothetical protein